MKKHYVLLGVLVVATVGLAGYAIRQYNHTPRDVTVQQALRQRDAALADVAVQKAVVATDEQAITNLKGDNSLLASQKAAMCAQLKSAKLLQLACQ